MNISPAKTKVSESKRHNADNLEVLEYTQLQGAGLSGAAELYYRHQVGQRLRFIRVALNGGTLYTEPGALQYMIGNIEIKSDTFNGGVGGILSRVVTGVVTGESVSKTTFTGTGQIVCEPTFAHYLLIEVDKDEVVTDRGAFIAGLGKFEFHAKKPDSMVAGALSGDGFFQTKIAGSGILVIKSPVPEDELVAIELNNERLVVDGPLALARTGNIKLKVERSSRSIVSSVTSGEGLVNVYSGTGFVWLAPTQSIYP